MAKQAASFSDLVRKCQQRYKDAMSRWRPPDGTYPCRLSRQVTGVMEDRKSNLMLITCTPVFQILEGNYAEKEFAGEMFTDRSSMSLGDWKSHNSMILGETFTDNLELDVAAVNTLAASEAGIVCDVSVGKRTASDGKEYPQIRIVEVYVETPDPASEELPPDDVPPADGDLPPA